MSSELYDLLVEYGNSDIYPFCGPGHKRNFEVPKLSNPYDIDVTRIDGFDSDYEPCRSAKEIQKKIAKIYNVKKAFISVNGSSAAMMAAVTAVPRGGKICVARNCHKSVFDALCLNRLNAIYIYPEEIKEGSMMYGGIKPEEVERLFSRHKDMKALVITSPTLEGVVSDIEEIAKIVHKHKATLIVDESHGAHFVFCKGFPKSAIELGADVVVESLYKTLPALSQTALIFVNNEKMVKPIQKAMAAFSTLDASTGLLASVDYCIGWCISHEKMFIEFEKRLNALRNDLALFKNFKLMDKEIVGQYGIYDLDPSKLVFASKVLNGTELGKYLLQTHKIQMEIAGTNYIVATCGVADTDKGMKRLVKAMKGADKLKSYNHKRGTTKEEMEQISYIYYAKTDEVYNDFIYLFPQGIPIIAPGEVFTEETRKKIKSYIDQGLEVIAWDRYFS